MKRRIALALLLAVLLFAMPALGEPMSTFDYTDDILEDGSLIYYFQELSLRLPADWRGKVVALQSDDGVSFYQRASYEKYLDEGIRSGGFLFKLSASANDDFRALPAYEYLGFSGESALNYYLILPTDYPAYNERAIRAEYDAMLEGVDFVAANAGFYRGQSGATGSDDPVETQAPAAPRSGLTPAQARYQFEHRMLPQYFYDVPDPMLDGIGRVGLYWLWESICTENGIDPTYPASDYVEHWYTTDDGARIAQIELPKPDADTLCYRIYFVYQPDTGDAGYYTIEYDGLLGEAALCCGWTPEHEHRVYGGAAILDRNAADYADRLAAEAAQIAAQAGFSPNLSAAAPSDAPVDETLARIECPEQGFSVMADPALPWDYREGTGISIYTGSAGSIPYVIVWCGGDLIAEPFEYLREQYTPHIQKQYGDNLVAFEEIEALEIGGRQLPAGRYTYRLQNYLIELLRIYDSTGARTVAYTAKYVKDQGDATLAALDTAIRTFAFTAD